MADYKVLSTKKLLPSPSLSSGSPVIEWVEQDFIRTEPVFSPLQKEEVARLLARLKQPVLAFTSQHAVQMAAPLLLPGTDQKSLIIFCLEGATRKAVRNLFPSANIKATAAHAAALAQVITEYGVQEIVFFCSDKRRDELPQLLSASGTSVQEVIVYRTIETPHVVDRDFDGVLFFSPSAVHSFFQLNQLNSTAVCFAIGPTTADSLARYTVNPVVMSEAPGQEAIINTVKKYFNTSGGKPSGRSNQK